MLEDLPYEDIGIRPDWRQLLIDELLSILLAVLYHVILSRHHM